MPITVKSAKGTLNTMGLTWDLNLQPLDATEHLNAGTLLAKVVGDSPVGFAAFYMKTVQSLFVTVTMGGTPITALTLKVTGYNQFNELVSENLAYVATGGQQTVKCYRRVTNVSIVAITGTPAAGDTVSLGYSLVTPRVPFLAKVPAGAILSVYDAGATGTQPVFTAQDTVSGDERYSIVSATTSPLVPTNGLGTIHVTVDPGAAGL